MSDRFKKLWLDFETYSACDIEKHGGMAYITDPSTCILCNGYAFDDSPPKLIKGYEDLPTDVHHYVEDRGKVYAHNATFDFRVWNYIGVEQMGWPILSLDQIVDTMALCLNFQIPPALANAGAALGITLPKNPEGKKLINICCKPGPDGSQPDPTGRLRPYFDRLFAYCMRDVEAMRQVVAALPRDHLIPTEQTIWEMTYEINTRGVPVDYEAIVCIRDYLAEYVKKTTAAVPRLTNGYVNTVNQIAKIVDWCAIHGYTIPSLSADNVKKALADEMCPEEVREILRLRQELGRSSTAKYIKLANLAVKQPGSYYVYDNIMYHGAGTGRWTGKGFQIHNLPRASVPNPEEMIEAFIRGDHIPDPVTVAKALIRPMIKAPPGYMLLVSDYSSIENRFLHWHANDYETLEEFRIGLDQYKTMASARYNVGYDLVTKPQRQMGKVIILGCGFGMGKDRFQETADVQFGMQIPIEEAALAIKAYREKYSLVVDTWAGYKKAAVKAVLSGQKVQFNKVFFATAKVKGVLWLGILLPSGKALYYMEPQVSSMYIPNFEHMGKTPTVTHLGMNPHTRKWSRIKLIPGRITENIVQGSAREALARGMLNVRENMPFIELLPSVHDEPITMVHEKYITDTLIEEFNNELCSIPWAPDLPLKAEGWIGKIYRKD